MKIRKIYYSSKFLRHLAKLELKQKELAEEREKIFRQNPFDPQLKTHKLKGKLKKYWSFSLTYSLRILFEFIDEETVGLIDIGPHEIYR